MQGTGSLELVNEVALATPAAVKLLFGSEPSSYFAEAANVKGCCAETLRGWSAEQAIQW